MKKVNLAKALKLKNSLIFEVNRLKGILARENSRNERSTSTIDRNAVFEDIGEKTERLINLKAAIASANVGIYHKLATLEERKSAITYFQSINTTDGEVIEQPRFSASEAVKTKFDAYLKQQDVDTIIADLQADVENIQDEVDAYNATTIIEV